MHGTNDSITFVCEIIKEQFLKNKAMNTIFTLKSDFGTKVFIQKLPFVLYKDGANAIIWSEKNKEPRPFFFSNYVANITRPATEEELLAI